MSKPNIVESDASWLLVGLSENGMSLGGHERRYDKMAFLEHKNQILKFVSIFLYFVYKLCRFIFFSEFKLQFLLGPKKYEVFCIKYLNIDFIKKSESFENVKQFLHYLLKDEITKHIFF